MLRWGAGGGSVRQNRVVRSQGVIGPLAFTLFTALIACMLLASCASEPPLAAGKPRIVRGQDIAAYAIHEECLRLALGDKLDYEFTANEPVDFNIHYHEGKVVVMPIVNDKTRQGSGLYAPLLAQDYCLMWEAGAAGALLDYEIRLRTPR